MGDIWDWVTGGGGGAIIGGIIGGLMFGYMGWAFAEFLKNIVFVDTIISPLMGGLITGAEFGIAGFGAGAGSAIGSGEDIGGALTAGALGFASGFALGFAAGYSYTAGWQSVLHGADIASHNTKVIEAQQRRIANMMAILDDAQYESSLLGRMKAEHKIANYFKNGLGPGAFYDESGILRLNVGQHEPINEGRLNTLILQHEWENSKQIIDIAESLLGAGESARSLASDEGSFAMKFWIHMFSGGALGESTRIFNEAGPIHTYEANRARKLLVYAQ